MIKKQAVQLVYGCQSNDLFVNWTGWQLPPDMGVRAQHWAGHDPRVLELSAGECRLLCGRPTMQQ